MSPRGSSNAFRRSLKGKSSLFIVLLALYFAGLGFYLLYQKSMLVEELDGLNHLQEREQALTEADLAAFAAITDLFVIGENSSREEILERVHRHFSQLQQRYSRLLDYYPERALPFKEMLRLLAQTVTLPTADSLQRMRHALAENKRQVDQLQAQNRVLRQQAMQAYLARSDRVTFFSLLIGLLGLGAIASVVARFFVRLTRDLLRLHGRVDQIVEGYRGEPLLSQREDELGQLIAGVNRMAKDLALRENELEIERQKQFHSDKMGTLGHVAAGFVHELGNPIAAIIGLLDEAREQADELAKAADSKQLAALQTNLGMMSDYAERMLLISEDLAALNQPRQTDYSLVDPLELISGVEKVLRYDERWYGIQIEFTHEGVLPALQGIPEQLSQLLMILITSACDALLQQGNSNPWVSVQVGRDASSLILRVADNGPPLADCASPGVARVAYPEEAVPVRSTLGLPLCQAIVAAHDGQLRFIAEDKGGCIAEVYIPLDFDPQEYLSRASLPTVGERL